MTRIQPATRIAVLLGLAVGAAACAANAPARGPAAMGSTPAETTPSAQRLATLRQAAGLDPCPTSFGVPTTRSDLPDLELACLAGGPPVNVAGLVGTAYVVNFWASWCTECVDEVPHFQQVADRAGDQVQVLGVNYLDLEEGALLAAPEFGLRFPSLFDPDGRLGQAFQVQGLPVTYFVDSEGAIVGSSQGAFNSAAELQDAIARELGVRL